VYTQSAAQEAVVLAGEIVALVRALLLPLDTAPE
jgi:hypothetical protein